MMIRRSGYAMIAAMLALSAPALAQKNDSRSREDAVAQSRDDVEMVQNDDAAMNAAIAEARRTLPTFLARFANPQARDSDFSVKYLLAGYEHIWMSDLVFDGDSFSGTLSNVPINPDYTEGQRITGAVSDITDWTWRNGDYTEGHYTTRVLLNQIDPVQAAALRKYFGWSSSTR